LFEGQADVVEDRGRPEGLADSLQLETGQATLPSGGNLQAAPNAAIAIRAWWREDPRTFAFGVESRF
jgi:hypothetical protein